MPRIISFLIICMLRGTAISAGADSLVQPADTLSVIGVGDIMLGTDYPSSIYLPPGNDCKPLLAEVSGILRDADVTFGNLEGTFAGDYGIPKPCKDTTMCFVFRMPEEYVHCLEGAGFDLLSVSNNHANDFGQEGRERTEEVLEAAGMAYAGSTATPSAVISRRGIRFGLAAFSPFRGCHSIKDTVKALQILADLEARCDILIVSVHGGAEGADHQHVTKENEVYLGYDRGNIYAFAHLAVDAGADIVFGHGPHVTRAMEIYRDRFIIYSLGNFCTYGRFNLRGPNGIAPVVKVNVAPDGTFLDAVVSPVHQPGRGGVRPDPGGRVLRKLTELNEADFPEIPLHISHEGKVTLEE